MAEGQTANCQRGRPVFGVLDKQAGKSGKVAVCRLNDPEVEVEVAWCVLRPAEFSSLYLAGLDSNLDWIWRMCCMESILLIFEFQGYSRHFASFVVAPLLRCEWFRYRCFSELAVNPVDVSLQLK